MNRHARRAAAATSRLVRTPHALDPLVQVPLDVVQIGQQFPGLVNMVRAWKNQRISVQVFSRGGIDHLLVRRHDAQPIHDWKALLGVVHELYPGRWAYECFPPEGKVVDQANIYHLWVMPDGEEPPAVLIEGAPL